MKHSASRTRQNRFTYKNSRLMVTDEVLMARPMMVKRLFSELEREAGVVKCGVGRASEENRKVLSVERGDLLSISVADDFTDKNKSIYVDTRDPHCSKTKCKKLKKRYEMTHKTL